jgi:hypothetical protein
LKRSQLLREMAQRNGSSSFRQSARDTLTDSGNRMSLEVDAETSSQLNTCTIRPLRKGEEREAAVVLAKSYEFDPRYYYWTYAVEPELRLKITRKISESVIKVGDVVMCVCVCLQLF